MNSTIANSWDCLKVPGLHLPKSGIAFSQLLLQFLVVHATIQTVHHLFVNRYKLPPLISQLFVSLSRAFRVKAGFILAFNSPFGATKIYKRMHEIVFPIPTQNVDGTMAMFAYMMFMFLIGVKMDFAIILKTGRKAFVLGLLDLFVPIGCAVLLAYYLYGDVFGNIKTDRDAGDLYVNLSTIPLTHYPNIVVLLSDLKMSSSELGRLALSSSLIGHLVSMSMVIITSVNTSQGDPVVPILVPLTLLMVSIFVIRPTLKWMIKQTPKGRPIKPLFLHLGYLFMLLGAIVTNFAGQLVLMGAFIVGCVVPDGMPFGTAIEQKLDFLVNGLLLPFYVSTAVMSGNYMNIGASSKMIFCHFALAAVAYASKFITNLICGLYSKLPLREALTLSFIMCTKGIVDIGVVTMLVGANVLTRPAYTMFILWVTIASTFSLVFVRSLYRPLRKYAGFQRRDIMHLKYNSELRILSCFLRSDRATSITRLLNACCPSEENPIVVYVLHLVKLVGRAHPAFISHDMQRKKVTWNSYSEEVIWAFTRFQQNFKNYFLSVHIFTSLTQFETMHEDMCTLALDKLTSIIILPFHRRFRFNGSIDSEDNEQKTLNSSILDKSPCSVGILVDRGISCVGSTQSSSSLTSVKTTDTGSSLQVAVVYIGGHDDQETLAFAMRLGRDQRVRVCVIRLVAFGQSSDLDDLDAAVLIDVQNNALYSKQFSYVEKTVKDGADTATYLRSIIGSYDLVMVGRQYNFACSQLMGIKELSEDTELGVIGDFLASGDLDCATSILVVQQQKNCSFK